MKLFTKVGSPLSVRAHRAWIEPRRVFWLNNEIWVVDKVALHTTGGNNLWEWELARAKRRWLNDCTQEEWTAASRNI